LLLKKTLPIVFVPHAFRLAPVAGHAELNASFSFRAKFFRVAFVRHQQPLVAWRSAISRFGFVTKHSAWCAMLTLVIAWLFSACASSPEEGVVREDTGEHATSTAAHFGRPSYAPGGDTGMNSAHSGF
jgi:hypothetical protein